MSRERPEVTAAAARYTKRVAGARGRGNGLALPGGPGGGAWQSRAWHHYGTVPEVRYAARWIGNAMGGARLFAGRALPDGTIEPAPDKHPATEAVATIAGGPSGQSQYLSAYGPHLVVAGEGWTVIQRTGPETIDWHVLSVSEVQHKSGKLSAIIQGEEVILPPGEEGRVAGTEAVAIRVWEHHPQRHMEADSPVRSSLPILEELELLNAAIAAIARSRLTGRGVLLIPKGTRFPTQAGQPGAAEDDLIESFAEVAELAIREPESAAATVPIILEVPAEMIDKIQRLTFESDFDRIAMELRNECIRRFATGLELPAPIVLGTTDQINHWGLWQLSEEAIRLAVEPRLATLAHALTTQWLQPFLSASNLPDAQEWLVWYDASPLKVRANRAQTALELYDRQAIGGRALRRETGFDESDAPGPEDTPQPALTTTTPPGGRPMLPADETTQEPDTLPASATPNTTAGGPTEAAVAATDGLVWAALIVAGSKIRRSGIVPRDHRARVNSLPAALIHTRYSVTIEDLEKRHLLETAFDRVPEVASRYGLATDCLADTLHTYVARLITTGQPHDHHQIPRLIAACCLDREATDA